MASEISDTLNVFITQERWDDARAYILKLLNEEGEEHWLMAALSTTYYEQRDYEKALELILKARDLAPHCPLILFYYACTLDMLERYEEAVSMYKHIIRRGVDGINSDECSEGIRDSRSIVNDCRYRLALVYASMGKLHLAKKWMREHISHRDRNTPSIYELRKTKRELAAIISHRDPRSPD